MLLMLLEPTTAAPWSAEVTRLDTRHLGEKSTETSIGELVENNKTCDRFSNFVKSGMEAYVLGDTKMNGQPGERHEIMVS